MLPIPCFAVEPLIPRFTGRSVGRSRSCREGIRRLAAMLTAFSVSIFACLLPLRSVIVQVFGIFRVSSLPLSFAKVLRGASVSSRSHRALYSLLAFLRRLRSTLRDLVRATVVPFHPVIRIQTAPKASVLRGSYMACPRFHRFGWQQGLKSARYAYIDCHFHVVSVKRSIYISCYKNAPRTLSAHVQYACACSLLRFFATLLLWAKHGESGTKLVEGNMNLMDQPRGPPYF